MHVLCMPTFVAVMLGWRHMGCSVYAYKSGKRIEDPFTPDTRIGKSLLRPANVAGSQ
jgi:hypothetical protein